MSLSPSYIPNYFSVSDILASEERILCKTEVTLPRLGTVMLLFKKKKTNNV